MPHPIEQPSRRDPANRLPGYLRPNLSDDAQQTLDALDRRRSSHEVPAMAITRLNVPFEDVFLFALKFFVAEVIIALPIAVVLWVVLTR